MEKYGFVYLWRDRKYNRYYIGSHWGNPNDGYICSSNNMRHNYRNRKTDFKRRIIAKITTNRTDLLKEEQRWLNMIKSTEKYYNINIWTSNPPLKQPPPWNKGKIDVYTEETKEKMRQMKLGRSAWNKGIKTGPQKDETKIKRANSNRGKKRSEETKQKMRLAQLGKHPTEESKEKNRLWHLGRIPWNKGLINNRKEEGNIK